jgi:hypothetical protein
LAAADIRNDPRSDRPGDVSLFNRLLALSTVPEARAFVPASVTHRDIYYPSCGLFVARDSRFVVAVKAGDNGDGHNHNDVGSVTIYEHGRPLLIDVGVETYTAKTFSADRYDIWTMQSAFHNLPTIAGVQQQAGEKFAARDVDVEFGPEAAAISMDIAGAYPAAARLASYRRRVCLEKGRRIEIIDSYVGAHPPELSLMLSEEPHIAGDRIVLGERPTIMLWGAGPIQLEEIAIADAHLRLAWPERIFRLLIPFAGSELRLRIE